MTGTQEHDSESAIEFLGPCVGGIPNHQYAHGALLAFQAIVTISFCRSFWQT
jgi:hypothetical protein